MNAHTCCHHDVRLPTLARRGAGAAGWIIPGAVLALLPKCPACLAAYVALWTGIGLSATAAGVVRTTLLAGSLVVLLYLVTRLVFRLAAHRAR